MDSSPTPHRAPRAPVPPHVARAQRRADRAVLERLGALGQPKYAHFSAGWATRASLRRPGTRITPYIRHNRGRFVRVWRPKRVSGQELHAHHAGVHVRTPGPETPGVIAQRAHYVTFLVDRAATHERADTPDGDRWARMTLREALDEENSWPRRVLVQRELAPHDTGRRRRVPETRAVRDVLLALRWLRDGGAELGYLGREALAITLELDLQDVCRAVDVLCARRVLERVHNGYRNAHNDGDIAWTARSYRAGPMLDAALAGL